MKTLLSTMALAVALGLPSLTPAQATTPANDSATEAETTEIPGILGARGQSDVFASELMGHDVYARRMPDDMASSDDEAGLTADGDHGMATMNEADLDTMDNIGQVNEIVLSNDGEVRAIVVGVGGFLGIGEHDVAIEMDQVTFATHPDDRSQTYIVVNINADMLEESPAYERTAMGDDRSTDAATAPDSDRPALDRPEVLREGYARVEVMEISTDMLVGESVYDLDENSVGTVEDLIVGDDGAIRNVIIDFGGFLGMGSSQVSLGFDELTILSSDGYEDVRVYVDATKEQIQALPQYEPAN